MLNDFRQVTTGPQKAFGKLLLVCLILGVGSFLIYPYQPKSLFAAFGFLSLAAMLIPPSIMKNYDLFSTWTLTCLTVVLGLTLRGVYIALGYPDVAEHDRLYFLGQEPDYFFWPSVLILGGLILLAIGYVSGRTATRSRWVAGSYAVNLQGMYVFVFVALGISAVCTYLYVENTGGISWTNLSHKRTNLSSLEIGSDYRGYQSLRVLAGVAIIAHLLVLADALRQGSVGKVWKFPLAILLFFLGSFIPFYSSSRGWILAYIIFSIAVSYYARRRLPWAKIFVTVLVGVVVFEGMSVLRTSKSMTVADSLKNAKFSLRILDPIVVNRNEVEIGKTTHIINAVPEKLPRMYGKTIAVYFFAPIPRSIWPSKPLIGSGPIVGTTIYKQRISGVPPGLIAELYWNFHIPGVLLGCFLFGRFLRYTYEKFKPIDADPVLSVVLYVYGPMQVGYMVLGTSIGFGITTCVINSIFVIVICRLLKRKFRLVPRKAGVSTSLVGR